jgi:hypothetical protein
VTVSDLHDNWSADWAWSIPLILLTVVGHSFGLLLITDRVVASLLVSARKVRRFFALTMSITVLLVITLHAIEAMVWAMAYVWLGALPDTKSAMLYSLEAMTTYGHAAIELADHWRLMGALEALNGMILFGLTTAFLFNLMQQLSSVRRASRRKAGGRGQRQAHVRHSPDAADAKVAHERVSDFS